MGRLTYRKSQRIASEKDFVGVLGQRHVVRRGVMRLYQAPNELGYPRFGVSVSKTCGGAVQRNRIKRMVREVFRRNQEQISAGDYILIVSRGKTKGQKGRNRPGGCVEKTFEELERLILDMVGFLTRKE